MSSVYDIARRDLPELWGSKALRYVTYALIGLIGLSGYLYPIGPDTVTTRSFVGYSTLQTAVEMFVPLLGLLLGYNAVVEQRSNGQLALLLSFPYSRREFVLGKFLARGGLCVVVIGTAGLIGGLLVVYPFGDFAGGWYVLFVLLTAGYGICFLGVGMLLSTLTRSRSLATLGAVGVYVLTVLLWSILASWLESVFDWAGMYSDGLPDWMLVFHTLEPGMLYDWLTVTVILGEPAPIETWYFNGAVALLVFLGWMLFPVAGAVFYFDRGDL